MDDSKQTTNQSEQKITDQEQNDHVENPETIDVSKDENTSKDVTLQLNLNDLATILNKNIHLLNEHYDSKNVIQDQKRRINERIDDLNEKIEELTKEYHKEKSNLENEWRLLDFSLKILVEIEQFVNSNINELETVDNILNKKDLIELIGKNLETKQKRKYNLPTDTKPTQETTETTQESPKPDQATSEPSPEKKTSEDDKKEFITTEKTLTSVQTSTDETQERQKIFGDGEIFHKTDYCPVCNAAGNIRDYFGRKADSFALRKETYCINPKCQRPLTVRCQPGGWIQILTRAPQEKIEQAYQFMADQKNPFTASKPLSQQIYEGSKPLSQQIYKDP